ncbi:MAG TPA: hypothetical protein DEP87_02395 [Candidatus Pacebacteria bacterium]|nr:hypothetical protein [Candidatus Paceibacterota bacterium]
MTQKTAIFSLAPISNFVFSNDPITYTAPSWADLHQLAFILASQIQAKNLQFDRLITLAKGGWPMACALTDLLQLKSVASVGVKFYAGVNQKLSQPEMYQPLPISIAGERVLLFDDVADSGGSLEFVTNYLRTEGAAQITTATLLTKPHSKIQPDFTAAVTSAWIVFPWEVVETVTTLTDQWRRKGVASAEIRRRFLQLKLPIDWVTSLG